jgi:selenide,water dikinase
MGPDALAQVLRPLAGMFKAEDYPDLLVGLGMPDDAAVYRLSSEQAIIETADFFPPVVDDPYTFGAVAAANALSDVYAMGGRPLFAINLAAFPDDLPADVLSEILRGGAEKVREAGAVIAGGHTVTDKEPKYGLAVTGLVHPERILTKRGAQVGDRLVLTKSLGTGVLTTAHKQGRVAGADLEAAVASMLHLNRLASEAAQATSGVHAVTDVTGFGLLGHAHEMAHLSGVSIALDYAALPWIGAVRRYAAEWVFPGGSERNEAYYSRWVTVAPELNLAAWELRLLHDPQTSGGLLIAVAGAHVEELAERLRAAGEPAHVIGAVRRGSGELVISTR